MWEKYPSKHVYYLPLSVVILIHITLFFIINIINSNGVILPYKFTFSINFSSIIPSNKNELEPMQISTTRWQIRRTYAGVGLEI